MRSIHNSNDARLQRNMKSLVIRYAKKNGYSKTAELIDSYTEVDAQANGFVNLMMMIESLYASLNGLEGIAD